MNISHEPRKTEQEGMTTALGGGGGGEGSQRDENDMPRAQRLGLARVRVCMCWCGGVVVYVVQGPLCNVFPRSSKLSPR